MYLESFEAAAWRGKASVPHLLQDPPSLKVIGAATTQRDSEGRAAQPSFKPNRSSTDSADKCANPFDSPACHASGGLGSHSDRVRAKSNFASRFKLIWVVQSPREKYFASGFQKYVILSRHPASPRGALRESSRTLGWDAVDAAASGAIVIAGRASLVSGTKRATTNGADADGQGVWS
jgi:hypothetical protein